MKEGAARQLAHDDLSMYNAAQRTAYLAIILCLISAGVHRLVI